MNSPKNLLVYNLLHRIYDPPRRFHSAHKNISLTCQRCTTEPGTFAYSGRGCHGASRDDLATRSTLASELFPHEDHVAHSPPWSPFSSSNSSYFKIQPKLALMFFVLSNLYNGYSLQQKGLWQCIHVNPKLPNCLSPPPFPLVTISSYSKSVSLFLFHK